MRVCVRICVFLCVCLHEKALRLTVIISPTLQPQNGFTLLAVESLGCNSEGFKKGLLHEVVP